MSNRDLLGVIQGGGGLKGIHLFFSIFIFFFIEDFAEMKMRR